MDLDEGYYAILLSNTPHPDRNKRYNRTLRQTFYKPVASATYPDSTNVHTGLDRVVWDGFDPIKGKRIALLTNQGAVDVAGRPILDVMNLDADVEVGRVFSPEHGFTGQAEAGEKVGTQQASVPVISLYGKQKKPTPDQLKGIDVFVVDLPDIGARYYTYMATMKDCMEVCAQVGVPVHVLDRPNPLGGLTVEGPVATRTGSLVCSAPIPIRHGMTLGELALYFKQIDSGLRNLDVTVSRLDNWPRSMMAPNNGIPWVSPSPNIPSFESALLYIGTCLFEGVNLNEGRGTETPFQIFGAPWLDAQRVIDSLSAFETLGCQLTAEDYTPRAIPGKSTNPDYKDVLCHGIRIRIASADFVRPFTLVYGLLSATHRIHPQQLVWADFFDTLAGGDGLRKAIQADRGTAEYLSSINAATSAFEKQRPRIYNP